VDGACLIERGVVAEKDDISLHSQPKENAITMPAEANDRSHTQPATARIMGDAAVDLHMHTTYSDGRWAPDALFAQLAQDRFAVVAVTDHDQMAHLPETQRLGAEREIAVIPATEVTTNWRGTAAHVVCYAPLASGFVGEALARLVAQTEAAQLANTEAVYATLTGQGYAFSRQAEVLSAQGGRLRRPSDNAALLLAHGYADSPAVALDMITKAGYRSVTAPIAEAVAAAHASGALTIIAHPGRGEGEIHRYDPPELAALLAEIPLDGVEVYYPTHTPAQVVAYEALTAERGLLRSAGSDSHGTHQRLPVAYRAERIAPLLARLGVVVD